jgi:hypothetical protein
MRLITLFLLILGFSCVGLTAPVEEKIEFRVNFGEEVSLIRIVKQGSSSEMILLKHHRPEIKRQISAEDFGYIREKVTQLPALTNSKSFCSRSFIEIEMGGKTRLACINGQNALSEQVTKLVNFLMIQF